MDVLQEHPIVPNVRKFESSKVRKYRTNSLSKKRGQTQLKIFSKQTLRRSRSTQPGLLCRDCAPQRLDNHDIRRTVVDLVCPIMRRIGSLTIRLIRKFIMPRAGDYRNIEFRFGRIPRYFPLYRQYIGVVLPARLGEFLYGIRMQRQPLFYL